MAIRVSQKNILYKTRKKDPNSFLESAVAFLPNTLPISLFLQTELLNHKLWFTIQRLWFNIRKLWIYKHWLWFSFSKNVP